MRRAALSFSLLLVVAAPGCRLLSLGVTCERDGNCREQERCVEGLCVREGGLALVDGGPQEDAGPTLPECPSPTDPKSTRLVLAEPLVVEAPEDLAALEGVVVVEGDLAFLPGGGLAAVDLPALVEVTGDLHFDAPEATATSYTLSLACLSRVGEGLILDGTAVSAFELPRLTEVGRQLTLEDGFESVPLPSLARVAGQLILEDLAVTDFGALSSLVEAGGLLVTQNAELTSLSGLEGLTALPQNLRVRSNAKLASLAGLSGVASVGNQLVIEDNPALPACEAEALRDRLVDGGFRGVALVASNDEDASCPWHDSEVCPPALTPVACPPDAPDLNLLSDADVAAAAATPCAANVVIAPGVTNVCLPALAEVSGGLTLGDDNTAARVELPALRVAGALYGSGTSLTTLSLPRLESVGSVELFDLPALERLYLPRLRAVTGALRVRDTSTPLLYLPQLDDIVGELELARLSGAASVDLPHLQDVDGILRLRENGALVGVRGLRSLREAGGLEVVANAALADFDDIGLEALFADVLIDQNPVLTSVDGIDPDLTFGGNVVTVTNNACLPQEDALAWAEDVSPGAHNVANNGTAVCE